MSLPVANANGTGRVGDRDSSSGPPPLFYEDAMRDFVLGSETLVRVVARSGRQEVKSVGFDFVVLYEDEWNGEELVGLYIGDTPLQDINGKTIASGSRPYVKQEGERLIVAEHQVIRTLELEKEKRMSAQDNCQKAKPGMLVEDATVVAGTDKKTGETVIKPKTTGGRADESMTPTDAREA